MGIQLKLRFKSLDLTFDGSTQESQLISLAKTITQLINLSGDRYPLHMLSTFLEQVDRLFPTLSLTPQLSALTTWLQRSPDNSIDPPSEEGDEEDKDTFPDLSWLPDVLETLINEAIRPALEQSKTLADYDRNELLQGLATEIDGEIIRIGFWIGSDRPSNTDPFNAADTVDDAITDFLKRRSQIPPRSNRPQPLPIPDHFQGDRLNSVWRVPYQARALDAQQWATQHQIQPAAQDKTRTVLLLIDVQNTFCLSDFELFVAGRSGTGAIDDNRRLCQFIYRNLHQITDIIPTLDTHSAAQIFHPTFWIDSQGRSPDPMTVITPADLETGQWQVNPHLENRLQNKTKTNLQAWARHYVQQLDQAGKYPLTIWPFHSMLGGIGHALVSAVEEAIFFHSIARHSPIQYELKGDNPLTENYSALRPEVGETTTGQIIAAPNQSLFRQLLSYDRILIAGQAKSHCVAWTIADLLDEIKRVDPAIARKIYLLEDCMSPVVIPGVIDFSEDSDRAFTTFADAGMNRILSTDTF